MAMSVTYATVHGRLVEENRGGVVTEYVPDTLGNVIMTTDESGTVTSATTYWPFGEVRTQTGTNPSPWGFCGVWGYLTDAVSRMYVRARHYRADTSRWLSVDLFWPRQFPYTYVSQCPVIYRDRTGLDMALDKRMSDEERAHAKRLIEDLGQALDRSLGEFDACMEGCTLNTSRSNGSLSRKITYPDSSDIRNRFGNAGSDGVCVILQYSYNCREGECGFAFKGFVFDNCWYVHICMRNGRLNTLPSCGPMYCILLHELIHTFGVDHSPNDIPALDCVNRVPGCGKYIGGRSGPMTF